MSVTTDYFEPQTAVRPERQKRFISLETFLERYSSKQDAFKYEWHNGIIEKTPRTMNRDQSIIQLRLNQLFFRTQNNGGLITELDMYLPNFRRTRRADMAYLTNEQLIASQKGDLSPSAFVIEVISNNDKINETDRKLDEYFAEGVQVVWRIFPLLKKIEVYTAVNIVKICRGTDVCSAEPVLQGFDISVDALLGV